MTEQLRKGVGISADQLPAASASAGANGRAPAGRVPGLLQPQAESVTAAGENVLRVLREGLARLQASRHQAAPCMHAPRSLLMVLLSSTIL